MKDVDSEGSFLRNSDFKNQIKLIGIQVDGPWFGLTVYESGGFCGLELVAYNSNLNLDLRYWRMRPKGVEVLYVAVNCKDGNPITT